MEQEFTYHAFISYSHRDAHVARKLHHYLEDYRIPEELRKKHPHLPKYLRPIFRDDTDLEPGELSETLKQALQTSRHLIVICSQNSITPNRQGKNWIEEEVRLFLSFGLNRKTRIIPVIPRGAGDLPTEDYQVPSLRAYNLLAVDARKKEKHRAFNDIIAKMAGVRPDDLWQRHKRNQQRKIRLIAGGILIVACLCWSYFVPKVSYYTDYIERNNIPEGLFEMTKADASQRHRHYRFTSHMWHLRKVEYCNSAGIPQEHTDFWNKNRPSILELEYGENGEVKQSIHRNARGKKITIRNFSPSCIDFAGIIAIGSAQSEGTQLVTIATELDRDTSHQARTSIGRFYVERANEGNNQGIITRELFCKTGNLYLTQNAMGVCGRDYKLDEHGRPVEIGNLATRLPLTSTRSIDTDVIPIETRYGVVGYRIVYRKDGQVESVFHINKEGEIVPNEDRWAQLKLSYDARGNCCKAAYLTSKGTYRLNAKHVAYIQWDYDEKGNRIRETAYDGNHEPCRLVMGYASVAWRYDERGHIIEQSYYDEDGTPCCHTDGNARIAWRYDNHGNAIEQTYYDLNGNPCISNNGTARVTWRYDQFGNAVEQTEFGLDGKLCLNSNGYAHLKWSYEEHGYPEQETYYGLDGKPCLHRHGYARTEWRYDERGNKIEASYYGLNNKLCFHKDGYACVRWKYDEGGNTTEQAFYGTDGKLCLHPNGYARVAWRYDNLGNLEKQSFYGEDDAPCCIKKGYAHVTQKHDSRGNLTEQTYLGTDGTPCNDRNGISRSILKYDNMGNLLSVAHYDAAGNQVTRPQSP